MVSRENIARAFLWLAVLVGGPLLGAKLFDLLVLADACSAHPPASLAMMPYGKACVARQTGWEPHCLIRIVPER